jgi:acetoacetyl-[acyl-carrier protein] synthase
MGLLIDSDAGVTAEQIEIIKSGTLVRRIERFDPSAVRCHQKAEVAKDAAEVVINPSKSTEERLTLGAGEEVLLPDYVALQVSSAGDLPSGFDPGTLYNSHHHPRGLKLSIYGASDALNSMGIPWDEVLQHIKPDEVAVYAGSALAQVDEHSLGGIFSQPLLGGRVNSKMMALSLSEMPADFINSYVINSVGLTGHNVGACATFLYNLRQGFESIQSGHAKVVIVGGVEAPLLPEVVEGFRVMGALVTDKELADLDGTTTPNHRRACRPFSTNAGFTLAEAGQFVVLMDDALAMALGAHIYGAVADVFIHADANKKSIAGPGIGNYITMAKAGALANTMLGSLKQTYVQAHGTSTPQNRITESHIINEVAKTFSMKAWPVAAAKAYVGHTVSAAAGDQLITSLGAWQYGLVPGIKTIDHIADDVHCSHLNILRDHLDIGTAGCDMKAVILNSKGFGGNNASAVILSPEQTMDMLSQKHGKEKYTAYQAKNNSVEREIKALDARAVAGNERIIYQFGESVMDASSVTITPSSIQLSGFNVPIDLPSRNPYLDLDLDEQA